MSASQSLQLPNRSLPNLSLDDEQKDLKHALATFQATLTDDERTRLQKLKGTSCDAESVIVFTADLDNLNPARRGKSIATRLYSLLETIQQFSQVVDTYVSSHPEIAALVWGSVKLTFMVLANFTSYFEKFSELLRGFDQLCPRFAEYRLLFPDSARLRTATYEFHASLISCCSEIIISTRRPWQRHLLSALSQSFHSEIKPYVDTIRQKAKNVQGEISLAKAQADHQEHSSQRVERREAAEARKSLTQWFSKSDSNFAGLKRDNSLKKKQQRWETLLTKLSTYDHAAAFKSARAKRHAGTAEWIFDTEEFQTWRAHEGSAILHITGKIGSGKTVLTSNIVDYLIGQKKSRQAFAFFYIRFDDLVSLNAEQILRSIIRQTLDTGSFNDELLQLFEKAARLYFATEPLLALLSEKIKPAGDFFLVLDGLDECPVSDRKTVMEALDQLCQVCQGSTRIKALFSSRESIASEVYRLHRPSLPVFRLDIGSSNSSNDLAKYAEEILSNKLSTEELIVKDLGLIESILEAIAVGGEGMFLWVFLTIENICTCRSDPDIRKALLNLPRKLSDIFDRALERIKTSGNEAIAQAIFKWTATVREPLTLEQLREALAVEIGQPYCRPERFINGIERLNIWCENLIGVEEADDTIHFSHHSIRTYLLEPGTGPLQEFHVNHQDWDHHIGEICLTYLDFNDFKTSMIKSSNAIKPTGISLEDYPAAIAEQTVRTAMPIKLGPRVPHFVKKSLRKSEARSPLGENLHQPHFTGDGANESTISHHHAFLQYATEFWLYHTTQFNTRKSKTWSLWVSMVSDEHAPWMDMDRQLPGVPELPGSALIYLYKNQKEKFFVKGSGRVVGFHRAIIYADSINHHVLLEHLVRMPQIQDQMFGVLLSSLLPSRKFYRHPEKRKEYFGDNKYGGALADLITEFIARGGSYWPRMQNPPPWTNDISCGIGHEIERILCSGRPFRATEKPWIKIFARLSIYEPNDDLFNDLAEEFRILGPSQIASARTIDGKTILDLVLERGGLWSINTGRWLLREIAGRRAERDQLARESLRAALKAQNLPGLRLLLEQKGVSWFGNKEVALDIMKFTVECRALPLEARRAFLKCLELDPLKDLGHKFQEIGSLDSELPSATPDSSRFRRLFKAMKTLQNVKWDADDSVSPRDFLTSVLSCIDDSRDGHCKVKLPLEISRLQWPRVVYCEGHRTSYGVLQTTVVS